MNSDVNSRASFIEHVANVFEKTIASCTANGSKYMMKKVSKMQADLILCQQVKETYGMDCFIDRSAHRSTVYHLNFILRDCRVIVFRISNKTPSLRACKSYVDFVKALEKVEEFVGHRLSFSPKGFKYQTKLFVDSSQHGELEKQLGEILKSLKGVLEITSRTAKMLLNTGRDGFSVSFPRSCAVEKFSAIADNLETMRRCASCGGGFDIKGIYKERDPHL